MFAYRVAQLISVRNMTTLSYAWHTLCICVTRRVHMWDMPCLYLRHDNLVGVAWHIHMCDMKYSYNMTPSHFNITHSSVWHDSSMCVPCPAHMRDTTHPQARAETQIRAAFPRQNSPSRDTTHPNATTHSYVWHDSIHTCGMTPSNVWHDPFTIRCWNKYSSSTSMSAFIFAWHDPYNRMIGRIHTCDMTHSHVWHDAFTRVTWRIHTCDMTHSYVWHDAFIRVTWRIHTCDMTHSYVWHDSTSRCWNTDSSSITTCTTTFSTQKCTPATSDGYVRVPLWKGRGLQSRVPFSTCVSFKMLKSLD